LGELLRVTESLENEAAPTLPGYDPEMLMRVQTQALDWVNSMWK
jgi:EAL and modified HD-GYP domain-containing signal transduction protein